MSLRRQGQSVHQEKKKKKSRVAHWFRILLLRFLSSAMNEKQIYLCLSENGCCLDGRVSSRSQTSCNEHAVTESLTTQISARAGPGGRGERFYGRPIDWLIVSIKKKMGETFPSHFLCNLLPFFAHWFLTSAAVIKTNFWLLSFSFQNFCFASY